MRRFCFILLLPAAVIGPLGAAESRSRHVEYPWDLLKPFVWEFQLATMRLADSLHKREPFDEFTRPPDIKDARPLHRKAKLFDEEIKADFLKHDDRLFWSMIPNDLGDMAIWQGYHTAFRAFKYAATHSPRDRLYLAKSLEGQALLQAGYGNAFLVRGIDPSGGDTHPHRYSRQGDPYDWVEDASGSSLTGHVFGLYCAYKFGNPEISARAKDLFLNLTRNLIANDYKLRNADGTATRYGDQRFVGWLIRTPNVLTTIAILSFADYLSDDPLFDREKAKLMQGSAVVRGAARGEVHLLWYGKEYHQHLAFMAYYVLLGTESDPELRRLLDKNFNRLFHKFRKEGNSFFSFVYGTYYPMEPHRLKIAVQTLQEFAFPKKPGSVKNSTDSSIEKIGRWAKQPLPVWRRPNTDIIWQRDPYQLDQTQGVIHRYSGVDFLIAYWMGRQLGLIDSKL